MNKYQCKENPPHVTTNQIRISYGRKVARFYFEKSIIFLKIKVSRFFMHNYYPYDI